MASRLRGRSDPGGRAAREAAPGRSKSRLPEGPRSDTATSQLPAGQAPRAGRDPNGGAGLEGGRSAPHLGPRRLLGQKRFPCVLCFPGHRNLDSPGKKDPNTGLPTARHSPGGLGTCVPHQQWAVAQVANVIDVLSPRDASPGRGPSAAGLVRGSLQMFETSRAASLNPAHPAVLVGVFRIRLVSKLSCPAANGGHVAQLPE